MSAQPFRLSSGGLIDRSRPKVFTFHGRDFLGYEGDTLASTLLAHGVRTTHLSQRFKRPRGVSGLDDFAQALSWQAVPATGPKAAEINAGTELECDVAVVGGGATGLTAAKLAAAMGARVILVEKQAELGGFMLGERRMIDKINPAQWVVDLAARVEENRAVHVLYGAEAVGINHDGEIIVVHTEPAASAQTELLRIRPKHAVWAAGAFELPLAFEDNDRPGIMLSSAARTFLNRYAVIPGEQILIATNNDTAYLTAFDLADSGCSVVGIIDERPATPSFVTDMAEGRGISVISNSWICAVHYADGLKGVEFRSGSSRGSLECDTIAMSGGLRSLPCPADPAPKSAKAVPSWLSLAGSALGVFAFRACVSSGAKAGTEAAMRAGHFSPKSYSAPVCERILNTQRVTGQNRDLSGNLSHIFLDLAREVTAQDLATKEMQREPFLDHLKEAERRGEVDPLQEASVRPNAFYGPLALDLTMRRMDQR